MQHDALSRAQKKAIFGLFIYLNFVRGESMAYKLSDLKSLMATDPIEQDVLYLKASLRNAIIKMIRANNWTQSVAAEIMGVSQPRISSLNQAKLDDFSIDFLITMLLKAGSRLQVDVNSNEDATAFLAMTFNKTAI